MLAVLDAGNFESTVDGALGALDKEGLTKLMNEMDGKTDRISDQTKRHLFKNGIASLNMFIDTM
jgi:hypothetical protein